MATPRPDWAAIIQALINHKAQSDHHQCGGGLAGALARVPDILG
jgi:hypothetical protein